MKTKILSFVVLLATLSFVSVVHAQSPTVSLGFTPPSLTDIITFIIRAFFVVGGLLALIYLLLGALAWITSGGDKESVKKAQEKIQAAIIGLIVIIAVLAIMVTLEQVVFNKQICVGISCPITIPPLLK